MRFQRIHEAVNFRPWFISCGGFNSVHELLTRAMDGKLPVKADMTDDLIDDMATGRPELEIDGNGIATICVVGVLGLHLSGIEKSCGNTDYKDIEREIGEAVGQGARGILFKIDSPGGQVTGCDECAQVIANAPVPKVVFSDGQICSGGYYLAAGADAIVTTQSADAGNIGVILPWVDRSVMWEINGRKFDPITNKGADLKATGHGPTLTDEQRAFLQQLVNDKAGLFQKHVSDYRPVDDEVWRAGWYSGQRAVDLGLVDFIGDESTAYGVLLSKIPI